MYNYYLHHIFLYRFGEGYEPKNIPVIYPKHDTLKHGHQTK